MELREWRRAEAQYQKAQQVGHPSSVCLKHPKQKKETLSTLCWQSSLGN